MKDNEVMVEESTEKDEWYGTHFTCLSCGEDFATVSIELSKFLIP